jgi:O-acetyl-ADP-ribose deacetylase (regulator of RNase III)
MKIEYVTGDLISGDETLIVHGCNAQGRYESGVAGAIRKDLPFAYRAYRAAFDDPQSKFSVGEVIWAIEVQKDLRKRIVGNMITQEFYGRDGKRYVSYDGVRTVFRKLDAFVALTQDGTTCIAGVGPIHRVGMPLIGSGLGGGSWGEISEIVERESHCFTPVVYLLDGIIPKT